MNETLEDLKNKRTAVMGSYNDLYDDLKEETYKNTIKELKEHITLLESELDKYRELLQEEIKYGKFYKTGFNFMQKVKTITVT